MASVDVVMRNVGTLRAGIPVVETLRQAAAEGLVEDEHGGFYYAALPAVYQRVLAFRIVVCLVAFIFTVFATVGHAVYYA